MIVKGRFSLDTNILIYAADRDAGERHERARALIAEGARLDCVLTVQALAEFYHATTRKRLMTESQASGFVRDWLEVFQVASADEVALTDAIGAVAEHRLSFWDAMLWAIARQCGCSAILSEDMQKGRRLDGIRFINPFGAGVPSDLALLLDL
jgi:predicted nucleic acid-binding protein